MSDFRGCDLNHELVEKLFESVVYDYDGEYIQANLLSKENGFPSDDGGVLFDADYLEDSREEVLFLLGQMKHIHEIYKNSSEPDAVSREMILFDGKIKYQGTPWTLVFADYIMESALMKLFYMAQALGYVSKIADKKNGRYTITFSEEVKPTYSPMDPRFDEWWKEN